MGQHFAGGQVVEDEKIRLGDTGGRPMVQHDAALFFFGVEGDQGSPVFVEQAEIQFRMGFAIRAEARPVPSQDVADLLFERGHFVSARRRSARGIFSFDGLHQKVILLARKLLSFVSIMHRTYMLQSHT